MKRAIKTYLIAIASMAMIGCGEDRSHEFYELTKENQWTYNTMKEAYLWADSIKSLNQRDYFATPSRFFDNLLYKSDNASFVSSTENTVGYGFSFSLMRDPLGIEPARVYALVEYVEPSSVAASAGLERGMWISAINGRNINMGTGSALKSGDAITMTANLISYDDEAEAYVWNELPPIEMQAATATTISPLPVTSVVSDNSGKIGYILCNSFDADATIEDIHNTLSAFDSEGVTAIVFDLRYFTGTSITNAALVASSFVQLDKQGAVFCTLYKDLKFESKENLLFSQTAINVADKPLYIITTAKTTGMASAFIKALRLVRGTSNLRIVGQTAKVTDIATESIESPYDFTINPATSIIADANGEILTATTPDYELSEYGDSKHIYPLGNKQEYLLYNIAYIIANGTLPADL